ncbi:MAG: hypothetical protein ABOK23_12590 [Candidatus Methanoperedens sp.]|nr:hypothetical protein [Candidatus Methanoperedens sp.]MCZ7396668.1 hypothetical protein [Candidatus Methanoperedens sp.]
MRLVPVFLSLIIIATSAGAASAGRQWINNITVNEYNMTWGYTETFTGIDSVIYRTSIDSEFGNNDSFITAWELLKLDKEIRNRLRSAIDRELDVRIKTPYLNTGINETAGIEVIDVDSSLSPGIIGNTSISDPIENKYKVTYRWKDSIFNASSIWFLGEAGSPVTIVLPPGVDVINTSGMRNVTRIFSDHVEITGFFRGVSQNVSENRGEITLNLAKNTSFVVQPSVANVTNATSPAGEKVTKPVTEVASKARDASVFGAGIVIILLIYFFKVRKG